MQLFPFNHAQGRFAFSFLSWIYKHYLNHWHDLSLYEMLCVPSEYQLTKRPACITMKTTRGRHVVLTAIVDNTHGSSFAYEVWGNRCEIDATQLS